jgi:hypothetical protein
MSKIHQSIKFIVAVVAAIVGLYLLSFLFIFDLTRPGCAEADSFRGKLAAYGPKPREWFCSDYMGYGYYTGYEWPFYAYSPLCKMWLKWNDDLSLRL